mmetsp:Transcript_68881/g.136272  ORF Transcript_68881/g.136272 Transcript_68881/m.136272 type:complete len:158 (-) Transcript_68881:477-950(-)
MERLSHEFLRGRSEWLDELRVGRGSFQAIAASARTLLGAMKTPPTRVVVVADLKKSCAPARRLPTPLWAMIMELVGGTHPLDRLLDPVLGLYSGGSPQQQLLWAQSYTKWCVDMNRYYCNLRSEGVDISTVDVTCADKWQERCKAGCLELMPFHDAS